MKNMWIIFALLVFMSSLPVFPDGQPDPEKYLLDAETAIGSENYEYAVKVLKEGKKLFPDHYRFNELLGDVYSAKELFSLHLMSIMKPGKACLKIYQFLQNLTDPWKAQHGERYNIGP